MNGPIDPQTILVIDDQEDNLAVFAAVLGEHLPETTVRCGRSVAEGFDLIAERPPDAILLDVQMPGMSGIEMTRKLKNDPATAHIPILLITAQRTDGRERVLGLEAGAKDFLGKPIDNQELVARLRIALRGKQAEDRLRQSDETHRHRAVASELQSQTILQTAMDGYWQVDPQGRLLEVNEAYCWMSGYTRSELLEMTIPQLDAVASGDEVQARIARLKAEGAARFESRHRRKDGSTYDVEVSVKYVLQDGDDRMVAFLRDITERKRGEVYRDMGSEVLRILNEPGSLQDLIQRVIQLVKTRTGFDAVALRLRTGEDFPYLVQEGFPDDFLRSENTLLERGADGATCRDCSGKACLACTCGLVLSGQTDPTHPLFTRGGSFWTNDSAPLLLLPREQDPRWHPRNRCIHRGYASFALVPIRSKDEIVGLLQLNDRRKGCFSSLAIERLEGLAAYIGEVLIRKRAEELLLARLRLMEFAADHSLEALLQRTLDEVEALTESAIGFYHFVEADEKTLSLQAWSTRTMQAFCKAEGKGRHYDVNEAGIWVDCIRERRAVIHNDYATVPHRKGLPPGHAMVNRELVVPIFRQNRIVAVLGVGNKPQEYTGRDVEIVTFIADVAWEIAVQKRAVEEARVFSERLQLALHGAQLGTWDWNVKTGAMAVNERWAGMLGYRLDEIEPHIRAWERLIHPDDRPTVQESRQAHLDGRSDTYRYEYRLRHKSQYWVWVLDSGQVIERDTDGTPFRAAGIHLDITVAKEAQEEAAQRTQELRDFTDGLPGLAFLKSERSVYMHVNKPFAEWVKKSREFISGRTDFDLFPPEVAERYRSEDQRTLTREDAFSVEEKLSWGGQTVWVSWRKIAIRDAEGKVLGLIGLGFDITARKQTEAALRESEIRMRSITDAAQDAILMMDPEGRISYWNPAAERILGYTSAEALGQNLHAFIVPSRYRAAHHAAFPSFQRTGQGGAVGRTLDLEARRKDGAEIPVQLSLATTQLNGQWHAVGILRDISERKKAEADLHESYRHLEAATAHANSLAAQAEMANIAKSEFLANMSHEIRTPLNGVIGMTGLLLDTALSDEQRRFAETIAHSGENLLVLLNDILDFSKIEAGRLELETLNFDLASLLDDFAATLALRAHEKGIELLCAADPDVPARLRGDPGRLRQILTNLGGNAIKFTPSGEVAIRVSLSNVQGSSDIPGTPNLDARIPTPASSPSVHLRFSVRDTGIGIPEEKIGLLFDKFSQVDASTTRKYGGTGLGLAISKQLVELMGGRIGVSSGEGKGSEFWFTVRLEQQAEGTPPDMRPPADLRDVRALVVDDNATGREMLINRLTAWGMRPSEARDGPTALQMLHRGLDEKDPFRVAVIDMQMPGMDGATLGRAIKADTRLAGTRMVILSSMGMRGDARHFEKIGFSAYALKPIRHQEFKAILSLALTDREGASADPPPIATRHTAREILNRFADRRTRILLAEDNATNRQVALGILKKLGLHADTANNGAEAVKALECVPYDLVLMDVQMPEMDGLEATRRIRNPASAVLNHRIPIIAMTAHALQGDRERFLESGMDDCVTKPVSPYTLADVLEKWIPKEEEIEPSTPHVHQGTAAVKGPSVPDAHTPIQPKENGYAHLPVFDKAGLLDRIMDDEALAKKVIRGFLDDIPGRIEALRNALATGDTATAVRQAHTIKGAAANVGGERLREIASELEMDEKAGHPDAVRAHMAGLEKEFDALRVTMEKEMGLGDNP